MQQKDLKSFISDDPRSQEPSFINPTALHNFTLCRKEALMSRNLSKLKPRQQTDLLPQAVTAKIIPHPYHHQGIVYLKTNGLSRRKKSTHSRDRFIEDHETKVPSETTVKTNLTYLPYHERIIHTRNKSKVPTKSDKKRARSLSKTLVCQHLIDRSKSPNITPNSEWYQNLNKRIQMYQKQVVHVLPTIQQGSNSNYTPLFSKKDLSKEKKYDTLSEKSSKNPEGKLNVYSQKSLFSSLFHETKPNSHAKLSSRYQNSFIQESIILDDENSDYQMNSSYLIDEKYSRPQTHEKSTKVLLLNNNQADHLKMENLSRASTNDYEVKRDRTREGGAKSVTPKPHSRFQESPNIQKDIKSKNSCQLQSSEESDSNYACLLKKTLEKLGKIRIVIKSNLGNHDLPLLNPLNAYRIIQ